MGSYSLDQENKIGIMGYDYNDCDDSFISDVSSVVSLDDDSDDVLEECDSSSSIRSHGLEDMSGLLQQLPSKRSGLSKYFQGKSQSFTSLANVVCLEDLAKPENPFNKKLKSCKSYVGLSRVVSSPTESASSSKLLAKRMSSGTSSSLPSNNGCRLATCSSFISLQ
ncbi:hypothetical protein HanRHA438_Chr15g0714131 [Helianthus annuus]|uniref:Oxidative stress 3 n=1 Tax=Helianthus annuus TaxID=4232 RepID=A0A251SAR0_HELAN|nr:uncharacterized protein LOC110912078 [Helianthus annuus]KAF5765271.1 hypothetical protein HanXRQr2_Chr15g0701801 [Helianthus annuus]KAJ0456513.1 hypothetical protein HanIR_Chr15g0763291 [Helianthus annuus]KAJ0831976.1 hypothetical protein HanPSC8_Chr15g0673381 [Helianthus annuus]KAJ0845480.1 hypothetical protein HanRHA438_Chr15g0714131 [Helianthus annuus]